MGPEGVLSSSVHVCVCERECDGLYQQLEWDCSLRGLYAQVPETRETEIQAQLLGKLSV